MLLDEIAAYLEDAHVGTVGTNIFVGRMPNTPDACLSLLEYGGETPVFSHHQTAPLIEIPAVQVKVRGSSYTGGKAMIQEAYLALCNVKNTTLTDGTDNARYLSVMPIQSPFYLGRDENERPEFSVNFRVLKTPS